MILLGPTVERSLHAEDLSSCPLTSPTLIPPTQKEVLLVGAGGLGCEALKNLVLSGFKNITVVDMDTVDVSNLNRQFLFRKSDVDKHKSVAAAEFIMRRRSDVVVKPLTQPIQSYSKSWLARFDLVVSGLDNVEARHYLNETLVNAVRYRDLRRAPPPVAPASSATAATAGSSEGAVESKGDSAAASAASDAAVHTAAAAAAGAAAMTDDDAGAGSASGRGSNSAPIAITSAGAPASPQWPVVRHAFEASMPDPDSIVPLVDGGTEGWSGQARLMLPGATYCLQCSAATEPPAQLGHFHLCTIASVPRSPEHCVMYAQLFAWPRLRSLASAAVYEMETDPVRRR